MLTQERLKELLHYDPETGVFTRIGLSRKSVRTDLFNKEAGSLRGHGYYGINVDGIRYYAHRLAWLYMTSNWPIDEIDHMDGNRANNKWVNLRQASRRMNAQNFTKPRSDNRSGYLGVSFDKARGKWIARIKLKNIYKYLGRFDIKEDARDAYLEAKRKHHKGCTI